MRAWPVLLLVVGCHSAPAQHAVDGTVAWASLTKTLPGHWRGTRPDGSTVDVSYRLVSRGSALVETFGTPGHETLTVYHRDGATMLATHYCAQGNQPRLELIDGDARHPSLQLRDATDVGQDEAVLVKLSYQFAANGTFDRTEVYRRPNGTLETTPIHFIPAS